MSLEPSTLVCTDGGRLVFWDIPTGAHEIVQESRYYEQIAISLDGTKLFGFFIERTLGSYPDARIDTWDLKTRAKVGETDVSKYGHSHPVIAVSANSSLAVATPQHTWWDLSSGQVVAKNHDHIEGLADPDRGAAMSPDGRWAITGFKHGAILWDMKSLKPAKKIGGFKEIGTHYFAFSPSSDFVIGSAGKRSTYLWRL